MKTVIGNYKNANEALNQVNSLIAKGYPTDSISVIAGREDADMFWNTGVVVEPAFENMDGAGDETLWERIKAFFSMDNTKIREANLNAYHDSILEGNVLVLVEDDMLPSTLTGTAYTADGESLASIETAAYGTNGIDSTVSATGTENTVYAKANDDETLRLREEQMDVDKQAYQAGEVVLHKRVVEETKTIEVPVWHEEVVIERHAVKDGMPVNEVNYDDETITIPVMAEEVEVGKHSVVTEEIRVHKRDVEKDQSVSESLRKEYLDVNRDGNTVIVDENLSTRR